MIWNSGEAFYLFENLVLNRYFTVMEYGTTRQWPVVEKIMYDEEQDALLFEDYIEIEKTDEVLDENSLVTNIYFYVDFDGKIISDAYSPLFDTFY